jgi:hypothetical protein
MKGIIQSPVQENYEGVTEVTNNCTVSNRRIFLAQLLNQMVDGIIRYGPFKGFKFGEKSWWSGSDRPSMLLGLYEQEILTSLQNLPNKYKYFIDVGAADGYYGIGVLVGNLFEKSWCYEISEQGRMTIASNAYINNVTDRVVIEGKADKDFYKYFSDSDAAQSVLFLDIEGGEFDLLHSEVLKKFRNSIIFIELHDWFFSDGKEKLFRLKNEVEKYFCITALTTTTRDLSVFEELREMSDTDRWLLCSEGRDRLMTWWRLDPK